MSTKDQITKVLMHPATFETLTKKKSVIEVKPYCMKELAVLYGVSSPTVKSWLRPFQAEIGEKIGIFYTVRQVKVIFRNLDVPHLMEVA